MMDRAKAKRLAKNLIVLAASLAFSLLAAEVILRLATGLPEPRQIALDKWIGHKKRPGLSGVYTAEGGGHYTYNSYGFRDREWSLKNDKYRAAVLGDSFTEALQVDADRTFCKIVEQKLPTVETLNFGIGSYGTIHELLVYRHYARKLKPRLAVLAFFAGNDLTDNLQLTQPRWRVPVWIELNDDDLIFHRSKRQAVLMAVWPILDFGLSHSALVQALYNLRTRRIARQHNEAIAEAGLWDGAFGEPKTESAIRIWRLTEHLLLTLRDDVWADRAKLLVMFIPQSTQDDAEQRASFLQKHPDLDPDYAEKRLTKFCEENGILSLPLSQPMLEYNKRTGEHLHGFPEGWGGHWNAAGQKLAGELLAERIRPLVETETQK